jgi:hypothetical protein
MYIYIYMVLRLETLKAVSFYLLHSVSTLNQCIKFSCVTVVCKHFAGYQGYPNYRWDLIRYASNLREWYCIPCVMLTAARLLAKLAQSLCVWE